MLYDKRWDAQTNPFTLESFISWLEKQPADKTYDYTRYGHCAIAQHLMASGVLRYALPSDEVEKLGWMEIVNPALGGPDTFGAALERARKLAKCS